MPDSAAPVGIFDSGVGGLTVYRRTAARLPAEHIVYLGDTARVPYGTKSAETVARYARQCAAVLTERGVKLLVVACNTASAYALEALRDALDIPVLGVIEPGARAAIAQTRNGHVGVIGTAGTIASRSYERALAAAAPGIKVTAQACPLFVPLAEEGWLTGDVPEAAARRYLAPLLTAGIDTLVLGCTHYPLLRDTIAAVAGPEIRLVDSAEETSAAAEELLLASQLSAPAGQTAVHRFLVTDAPENFGAVGRHFLGQPLAQVEWIDC